MKINKDEICKVISDVLEIDVDLANNIGENEDLVVMGMDSIKFISIVVALEEAFEIEYPDESLFIAQSNTLKKLVSIVSDALEKKSAEGATE